MILEQNALKLKNKSNPKPPKLNLLIVTVGQERDCGDTGNNHETVSPSHRAAQVKQMRAEAIENFAEFTI